MRCRGWRGGVVSAGPQRGRSWSWPARRRMPVVEAGLAAGRGRRAKAPSSTARWRDAVEQSALVAAATGQTVEEVARAVDRWQFEHRPTAEEPVMSLRFTPTAAGTRWRRPLTRKGPSGSRSPSTLPRTSWGSVLPWAERRLAGLVAVCRHFLDQPTSRRDAKADRRWWSPSGWTRWRLGPAGCAPRLGRLPAGRRGSPTVLDAGVVRCYGPGLDAARRRAAHPQRLARPGPRRDPP